MISLLYVLCYTAVVILSRIYPDDVGWYLVLAFALTVLPYIFFVMLPYNYVYSIKRDDIHHINISDVTDLPYGAGIVYTLTFAAMIFVPMFIPAEVSVLLLYVGTVAVLFVCPVIGHIISRARLCRKLKKRGFSTVSGACGLIFKGMRNVYFLNVRSADCEYKIGILGGVGQMKYEIDGDMITSTRVNSVLREYILELERVDSGIINSLAKLYLGKPRTEKLNTAENGEYLLIGRNAFIISNGGFVSRGSDICGMHVVDMSTGEKYIR